MPVSINSRYRGLPVVEAPDPTGKAHPAVGIRPSPPPPEGRLFKHRLTAGESLEYLAWRYYGASELWWRIADANPTLFPFDLTPGAAVVIPSLAEIGRRERDRRF